MTLEERYRRLLRIFPKAWRKENEDVFLDTLLEHAGCERDRPRFASLVDLGRTAAILHWRELARSSVGTEVSASILLTASAGLALTAAASLALLTRLVVLGYGLNGGTIQALDVIVASVLLLIWPLTLVLATTWHTKLSVRIAGTATVLLAVAYLARSTREYNFILMDQLFLYLTLPLVATLSLRAAVASGQKIDRRWVAVAGILAVPLTMVVVGVNVHLLWLPPRPYSSAALAIVIAAIGLSTPILLAVGVFWPRVLLAGALLSTPLAAAGLGQLVDSLTIQNARPGLFVARPSYAIAATIVSVLPMLGLLFAGLALSLHQARRTAT